MISKDRSLASRMERWRVLFTNGRKRIADLPHADKDLGELERLYQEVTALRAEQAVYQAKVRELTSRIRGLSRVADRIRGRIGAHLRGQYGFDSNDLIRFGFRPRRPASFANREEEQAALAAMAEEPQGASAPSADEPQEE